MTAQQPIIFNHSSLDEQDFYLWIETTAKQLKEWRFAEIDLVNLIEKIESMGRSEKRAVESSLVVPLMHFLKYQDQSGKRSNSWFSEIFGYRCRLMKSLQDSPSLHNYLLGCCIIAG